MSVTSNRIVHKLMTTPPRELLRTVVQRTATKIERQVRYRIDQRHGSNARQALPGPLLRFFSCEDFQNCKSILKETCLPDDVLNHYLEHRFNLLGSGWVPVKYGLQCQGLGAYQYRMSEPLDVDQDGLWLVGRINDSNLDVSRKIWGLIDGDYIPIDWQLDFKSGYRWNEKTWYHHVSLSPDSGVDIKVPWELARGEHLPQLALAYAACVDSGKQNRQSDRMAREIRNQILDFVATNPVRFGVNWRCTMDAGIRIANWLLAYDFMRAAGVEWDDEFDKVFRTEVYVHGKHITENLEWSSDFRGNHYLANITGLLFAAAFLPRNSETDAWLGFAVQELIREVKSQFTPDGANFEASTSYHRLSAEMVAWGTALVLALDEEKRKALLEYDSAFFSKHPRPDSAPIKFHTLPGGSGKTPFPPWYWRRLEEMAEFTIDVTKPSGRIHQIGDNDSGRFFNLQPVFHSMTTAAAKIRFGNLEGMSQLSGDTVYRLEDSLDHRSLVSTVQGLIPRKHFENFCGSDRIESELVRSLTRRYSLLSQPELSAKSNRHSIGEVGPDRFLSQMSANSEYHQMSFQISLLDPVLLEALSCHAYDDFGLYIWKSAKIYFAIRCGPVGQGGIGGHAHNDQLAVELTIGDEDWVADPGTCLYLPDREKRNAYRSVFAHFAPRPVDQREPGRLDLGIFRLVTQADAKCLYFGAEGFVGCHSGYGKPIYRVIQFVDNAILVTDIAEKGLVLNKQDSLGPVKPQAGTVFFSPGYGIVQKRS